MAASRKPSPWFFLILINCMGVFDIHFCTVSWSEEPFSQQFTWINKPFVVWLVFADLILCEIYLVRYFSRQGKITVEDE